MQEEEGILPFFTEFIIRKGFTQFKNEFVPTEGSVSFKKELFNKLNHEGGKAIATFESELKTKETQEGIEVLLGLYLTKIEKIREKLVSHDEANKYPDIQLCLNRIEGGLQKSVSRKGDPKKGTRLNLSSPKKKRPVVAGDKRILHMTKEEWIVKEYLKLRIEHSDLPDTEIYAKFEMIYKGKPPSPRTIGRYLKNAEIK